MLANNIWKLTAWVIEKLIFPLYDALRLGTNDNWWTSNIVNWILMLIGLISLVYWMGRMYGFKRDGKEDSA